MAGDLIRRFGATRLFARIHPHLARGDAFVYKISGGRLSTSSIAPGLQQLLVTTVGRKTGEPRTVTLVYFPDGEDLIVVGSNYGRPNPPAWALNLLAQPEARVVVRGKVQHVTATVAAGPERERLWLRICHTWPAYKEYDVRSGDRVINIFVLTAHG